MTQIKINILSKIFVYSILVDIVVVALTSMFADLPYYYFIWFFSVLLVVSIAISFLSFYFIKDIIEDIIEDRYEIEKYIKKKMDSKIKLKNRQRNDMISAIAHEFRNPISVIIGYAQTLIDDDEIDKDSQNRFLNKIYDNSLRIEDVLSRLILWNKFESKSARLEMYSFSLDVLAKEIINNLNEKYTNRDIKLTSDDSIVDADRLLIGIVLQNLIENALKYSKGSVLVEVLDNVVSVVDSGIGIKEEDIKLITKKFYRSGEHDWNNSMGIGLSIVKKILKLHNSELQIDSQENLGSKFSFIL